MIVLIHIFTQQVTGIQPRRNIYFNEYNLYNKQKGSLKSIRKVFVFILELRLELSSTSRKMTSQNLKKPSSLESNEKRFSNVRKSKGLHHIVFDKCGCLVFFFFCRAAWPWRRGARARPGQGSPGHPPLPARPPLPRPHAARLFGEESGPICFHSESLKIPFWRNEKRKARFPRPARWVPARARRRAGGGTAPPPLPSSPPPRRPLPRPCRLRVRGRRPAGRAAARPRSSA